MQNRHADKEEEWEQGMWIERATVGELSTRPLGANPEPPSTLIGTLAKTTNGFGLVQSSPASKFLSL
jgi:hypothetical protein